MIAYNLAWDVGSGACFYYLSTRPFGRGTRALTRHAASLISVAFVATWIAQDLHLITQLVAAIASGLLLVAVILAPRDDDDDDDPPRRRLRRALKRAKSWLATGTPARRRVPA